MTFLEFSLNFKTYSSTFATLYDIKMGNCLDGRDGRDSEEEDRPIMSDRGSSFGSMGSLNGSYGTLSPTIQRNMEAKFLIH